MKRTLVVKTKGQDRNQNLEHKTEAGVRSRLERVGSEKGEESSE